jgi:peptide/nickel transport system permease protein
MVLTAQEQAALQVKEDRFWIYRRRLGDFWKLYRQSSLGKLGLGIVLFFVVVALVAPWIAPYDPFAFVGDPFLKPSMTHILGTDQVGRDIFSRVIFGTRISLLVGLVASGITIVIGSVIGLVSGYLGGWPDNVLMRITDLFLILPSLPLMLIMAAILGKGITNIIIVIAVLDWTATARMVRSQTLSLKERPFTEASRAIGSTDLHTIARHIVPNVFPLVFANGMIAIVDAILSEAGLSFLGFGDPSAPSWGMVLHFADTAGATVNGYWWYIVPPGICIMLLVMGFAFISYSTDQILNPRLRRR